MQFSGNLLWLLAGICLSTLAFLAFGYLLASLIPTASAATVVGNVLLMPMLFLSGITVPLELMPETVQNISRFIPLTCVATLLRGLWFGEPVSSYLFEVAILGGTLVVATVLAANLNHLQGTQDKPAGTLPALRPDATHAKPNAGKGSAMARTTGAAAGIALGGRSSSF